MGEASPVIELKDVGISFAGRWILRNINLRIEKSERVVIIGPSGQGKSLLLKIMSGIIKPTEGEVFIEGQNLEAIDRKTRHGILCRMGMLFQKNALFDSMTCAENIAFPLIEVSQFSSDEITHRIDLFLKEVAIPHARDLYPDEISGGMQKRLGIARALAMDPEIIFYDDPTAGLDPITSRMIVDLIMRLQEQAQSTVVAITNDMHRAYQLANRIIMVIDRTILITGNESQTRAFQDQRVQQFISGALVGPLTEAK